MWTVIYMDPKTKDRRNTLHRDGCRDIEWSKKRGGNPVRLVALICDDALTEAQYGGLEPSDGSDLGYVTLAPCAK